MKRKCSKIVDVIKHKWFMVSRASSSISIGVHVYAWHFLRIGAGREWCTTRQLPYRVMSIKSTRRLSTACCWLKYLINGPTSAFWCRLMPLLILLALGPVVFHSQCWARRFIRDRYSDIIIEIALFTAWSAWNVSQWHTGRGEAENDRGSKLAVTAMSKQKLA